MLGAVVLAFLIGFCVMAVTEHHPNPEYARASKQATAFATVAALVAALLL
jgi:hypothetical protein